MKMLFVFLLLFISVTVYAQTEGTIWDEMKVVTTDDYEISVPAEWRDFSNEIPGMLSYFEASGLVFSAFYENSPLILVVFVMKQKGDNLEDVKEKVHSGYRENTDRVFEDGFEEKVEKVKLSSGEDAYILSTRFFRISKNLYQNRYDLVTYSEKSQTGYFYGVSIQHVDQNYTIENDLWFYDFVKILFSYFKLL